MTVVSTQDVLASKQPAEPSRAGRLWVVDQKHPHAADNNNGSPSAPLRTVNAAAQKAQPGDTVRVFAGVYRERISPARGGTAQAPIVYEAAPGNAVYLRGSEVFKNPWHVTDEMPRVFRGSLHGVRTGAHAYDGVCDPAVYGTFNAFHCHFNRELPARPHDAAVAAMRQRLDHAVKHQATFDPIDIAFADAGKRVAALQQALSEMTDADPLRRRYLTSVAQVYVDGEPLTEVATCGDLQRTPGTWMADEAGENLLIHPPAAVKNPNSHLTEVTVRHTVFSPLARRLGYITIRGFVIEHAANHFPTWGAKGWAQAGMLSCRTGHHWVIESNVIRYAKGVGLDCGSEGGRERMEFGEAPDLGSNHQKMAEAARDVGYHLIRHNDISDNGHCGLAGIGHYGTRVLHNRIERNNRDGWTSPWWEFGGIKFHFFFDGLIEGNLIRDNEAHGIWIDNQWRGSRITRNIMVNNLWSGVNVELGRGPVLIDNNIIAHTRQGDGVYGHDVADVTIAHNLLYANANFGVWFAYATPRVKPKDGCWDIRTLNNIVMGNRAGAIGYSLPWDCAGNNSSDRNLFIGAGEYLDEGSGPNPPQFQITNVSHCGSMQRVLGKHLTAQTPERVWTQFQNAAQAAGLTAAQLPSMKSFQENHLISMEVWQRVLGNDQHSLTTPVIRDGLSTRVMALNLTLDDTLTTIQCLPVCGVDADLFGQTLSPNPLPGPIQSLRPGSNVTYLWPVPERD